MVYIASLEDSLVHHYWALYCFTGHGLHRLTTRFTGSSFLGMACIVSLHASMVHSYWALFVFFHFPHLFIFTGHGLYCLTTRFKGSSSLGMLCGCFSSCLTFSSLLGIVWAVSCHASLVHHYLAWFVLFRFMVSWFLLNRHSWIVTLHAWLVLS